MESSIDLRSLVQSVKDLEVKLSSQQYRPDVMPPWAASLLPRIDRLETKIMELDLASAFNAPLPSLAPLAHEPEASLAVPALEGTTPGEPGSESAPAPKGWNLVTQRLLTPKEDSHRAREERMVSRIMSEFEHRTETLKLKIDASSASVSGEIDRLHKLLQIRPTNSELQKVLLMLSDSERRTKLEMEDLTTSLRSMVEASLATELQGLASSFKSTENLNDRVLDNISKKIDLLSRDVSELKELTAIDFDRLNEQTRMASSQLQTIRSDLVSVDMKVDAVSETSRCEVMRLLDSHDNTLEGFKKLVVDNKDAIASLNIEIKKNFEDLERDISGISDHCDIEIRGLHLSMESVVSQTEEQRQLSTRLKNDVNNSIAEFNDLLVSLQKQTSEMAANIDYIQKNDPTDRIELLQRMSNDHVKFGEFLQHKILDLTNEVHRNADANAKAFADATAQTNELRTKGDRMSSALKETQSALDLNRQNIAAAENAITALENTVQELLALRVELGSVKESLNENTSTVRGLEEKITSLEVMIKYVSESSVSGERRVIDEIAAIEDKVHRVLSNHGADITSRIEAMQESIGATLNSLPANNNRMYVDGKSVAKTSAAKASNSVLYRSNSNISVSSTNKPNGNLSKNKHSAYNSPWESDDDASSVDNSSMPSGTSAFDPRAAPKSGSVLDDTSTPSIVELQQRPMELSAKSGEFILQDDGSINRRGNIIAHKHAQLIAARASLDGVSILKSAESASIVSPQLQFPSMNIAYKEDTQLGRMSRSTSARRSGSEPAQSEDSSCKVSIAEGASQRSFHRENFSGHQIQVTNAPAVSTMHDEPKYSARSLMSDSTLGDANRLPDISPMRPSVTVSVSSILPSNTIEENREKTPRVLSAKDSNSSAMKVSEIQPEAAKEKSLMIPEQFKGKPNEADRRKRQNDKNAPNVSQGVLDVAYGFEYSIEEDLNIEAENVYYLCRHFEEIALRRTLVPEIGQAMSTDLASIAVRVAEAIAQRVDLDALLRVIKARADEVAYGDSFVANRRLELVDRVLRDASVRLEAAYPNPGIVRLDARDYFLRKAEKVLQAALSKHDQVIRGEVTRMY
jgi:hypothetical protein